MSAFFKSKNSIETEDEKAYLVTFKEGKVGVPNAKQYIQVSDSAQSNSSLRTSESIIKVDFAAEKSEEDSALSFGAAVGAMAVAVSALAF